MHSWYLRDALADHGCLNSYQHAVYSYLLISHGARDARLEGCGVAGYWLAVPLPPFGSNSTFRCNVTYV